MDPDLCLSPHVLHFLGRFRRSRTAPCLNGPDIQCDGGSLISDRGTRSVFPHGNSPGSHSLSRPNTNNSTMARNSRSSKIPSRQAAGSGLIRMSLGAVSYQSTIQRGTVYPDTPGKSFWSRLQKNAQVKNSVRKRYSESLKMAFLDA